MLCTEESMSEVFYVMNQNPPSYSYQVTVIGKQNQYFDILDVFMLMKSAQTYLLNNKKEIIFSLLSAR